jgi:peroxiredoxin
MKQLLATCCVLWLICCNGNLKHSLEEISLVNLDGVAVNMAQVSGKGIVVFVFMSPDCPLCINYTRTIMMLKKQFESDDVTFISVYAGRYHEKEEIIKFHSENSFDIQGILDPDYKLTDLVSATVTPEAVVIISGGVKAYSGAIDDWAYATGKKRPIITNAYLESALSKLLKGSTPDPAATEPIGCLIEL